MDVQKCCEMFPQKWQTVLSVPDCVMDHVWDVAIFMDVPICRLQRCLKPLLIHLFIILCHMFETYWLQKVALNNISYTLPYGSKSTGYQKLYLKKTLVPVFDKSKFMH